MYLILFTIIYCVITWIFNLNNILTFGIYIIGLSVAKGVFTKELRDVYNFRKTSDMYGKVGFKESLMELISLLLVFVNTCLIDYEPLTPFEFIWLIFLLVIVYRFLFWGIIRTFRKDSIESSHMK